MPDTVIEQLAKDRCEELVKKSQLIPEATGPATILQEYYVRRLRQAIFPKEIATTLSWDPPRRSVDSMVKELEVSKGNIGFMPIVPFEVVSYYSLKQSRDPGISLDGLAPGEISNKVEVPKSPYYILDIDLDVEFLDVEEGENFDTDRRGLTAAELLALDLYTAVSDLVTVKATGSKLETNSPAIAYGEMSSFADLAAPKISVPTCKLEVVPAF